MVKIRVSAAIILLVGAFLGFFVLHSQNPDSSWSRFAFRLGLDLSGGTELIYRADISQVQSNQVGDSMGALRDVIERRVNIFGVTEPIVQTEEAGLLSGNRDYRLIVELPGITDVDQAIAMIGQTPILEFKLLKPEAQALTEADPEIAVGELFISTDLTGRYLERAQLEFNPTTQEPVVAVTFDDEGKELFALITREHTGEVLGIFLDGVPISTPVIRDEIPDGQAIVSGSFTPPEAKELVRQLNFGALPVPIELISTQSVGASLGEGALASGVRAGVWGFLLIVLFLLFWYRLPGLIAALTLVLYIIISLAVFKIIPVTLTAAGLAGFILSLGMAVDANILIFERFKEESGKSGDINQALRQGFSRAWQSIRDSNISSIITSVVLFWLGTSAVKGFALTLGVGVLVSMLTAITISRTLLLAVIPKSTSAAGRFLFGSGLRSTKSEQ